MPLLPLEPCVFPESLLTSPPSVETPVGSWWVLHTRPRAEKSLARKLLGREIPFFLPLYQNRLAIRGRVRTSYLPLFPSYVFLQGDGEARLHALETNLVAHCLPVGDPLQLYEDLCGVRRLLENEANTAPEDRLQPGSPVEIIAGPLAGMTGKVIRRGSQLRFFVEVRMLQQGVSIDIESWMIQPVSFTKQNVRQS